jgi:aryl-alcohol dehydrogenase-like predicted oxidoreductase
VIFDYPASGVRRSPELTRMGEEGLIKGCGISVNTPERILRLLDVSDPDVCVYWRREYS